MSVFNDINTIYAAVGQSAAFDSFRLVIETDFSQALNLFKSNCIFYHGSAELDIPTYQIIVPRKRTPCANSSPLFLWQMSKYKNIPRRDNSIFMNNFKESYFTNSDGINYIVFPKNNAKLGVILGEDYNLQHFLIYIESGDDATIEQAVRQTIMSLGGAVYNLGIVSDDLYSRIRSLVDITSIDELNAQIEIIDSELKNISNNVIINNSRSNNDMKLLTKIKRVGLKKYIFSIIHKIEKFNPHFKMYSIKLKSVLSINEDAEFWTEAPCLFIRADNKYVMDYLSRL